MPSGSHRSSGGSHSSGGSSRSSGGFSSSSGHRGGSYGGFRFTFFFPIGRRSDGSVSGAGAACGILTIFAVLVAIMLALAVPSLNRNVKKVENDYLYYQNMIDNAKEDPRYIAKGKYTDMFEYESSGKFYLEYVIFYGEGQKLEGETYATYTLEEASALLHLDEVSFAINCKNDEITQQTDSIPMSYDGIDIELDIEYTSFKPTRVIVISVVSVILAILVIVAIITGIKATKAAKNAKAEAANAAVTDKPENTAKKDVCMYCGSHLSETDKRCPGCGANVRK